VLRNEVLFPEIIEGITNGEAFWGRKRHMLSELAPRAAEDRAGWRVINRRGVPSSCYTADQ